MLYTADDDGTDKVSKKSNAKTKKTTTKRKGTRGGKGRFLQKYVFRNRRWIWPLLGFDEKFKVMKMIQIMTISYINQVI